MFAVRLIGLGAGRYVLAGNAQPQATAQYATADEAAKLADKCPVSYKARVVSLALADLDRVQHALSRRPAKLPQIARQSGVGDLVGENVRTARALLALQADGQAVMNADGGWIRNT